MYPKVIYFCHKDNAFLKKYSKNWKKINPEYNIQLYDDDKCAAFLLEHYGEKYEQIFHWLKDGPIKADFWRICILYKFGGVYCDIDNQPFVPIDEFVEEGIDFLTCLSFWDKKGLKFNPNFMISFPQNPILYHCIQWYVTKFDNQHEYGYWKWSIMRCMTQNLHIKKYKKESGLYETNDGYKIQLLRECYGKNHYDSHMLYKGKRLFNNRYNTYDCQTRNFVC